MAKHWRALLLGLMVVAVSATAAIAQGVLAQVATSEPSPAASHSSAGTGLALPASVTIVEK